MDKWLVNGAESDTVTLDDRGLAYGDGLFETIACRGGRLRFLDEHIQRLTAGCNRLGIRGVDYESLRVQISDLARDQQHATVKIIVTSGSGRRGYRRSTDAAPTVIAGIAASAPLAASDAKKLRYCETLISRNPLLAGLKTLNRIEQVLARSEWFSPDIAEGLMLDEKGNVICGTMSNLFYVAGGALLTPRLEDCGVDGIMRGKVIDVARQAGIRVTVCDTKKTALESANEVFITNALIGVWPVAELAGLRYSATTVTDVIKRALFAIGVDECAH